MHWRGRGELMAKLKALPRYIACGRVTKRPIFEFIDSAIHPNDALAVFPLADDYSFGILQSSLHWEWFKARCSTLEERFRYTSDTVFDSFPWPQSPTKSQVRAIAKASVEFRSKRRQIMSHNEWSLRALYRAAEMEGKNPLKDAQATLDDAVASGYGKTPEADALAFLLDLNRSCSEREAAGGTITGPGLPEVVKDPGQFVSEDCVRMPE